MVNRVSTNGFGVAINPGEYIWGSNSDVLNKALLLIYGYEETGNINYYESALMQLNYILGCNAHNLSFLTGVGTNSVLNPHHRPSASDGVGVPVPGLLAGGPDQYLMIQHCNLYLTVQLHQRYVMLMMLTVMLQMKLQLIGMLHWFL